MNHGSFMVWSKDSKHRNCLISISSPLVSYNQNIFHQNWDYTEKFTIIKAINTWVLSVIKILNQRLFIIWYKNSRHKTPSFTLPFPSYSSIKIGIAQ